MNSSLGQMQMLGTIGNILTVLVLLVGLIVVIVSYFKGKSKVALARLGFCSCFCIAAAQPHGDLPMPRS